MRGVLSRMLEKRREGMFVSMLVRTASGVDLGFPSQNFQRISGG